MRDEAYIRAKWEKACQRYVYSQGAYSAVEQKLLYHVAETLADILELPEGATGEKCREIIADMEVWTQ